MCVCTCKCVCACLILYNFITYLGLCALWQSRYRTQNSSVTTGPLYWSLVDKPTSFPWPLFAPNLWWPLFSNSLLFLVSKNYISGIIWKVTFWNWLFFIHPNSPWNQPSKLSMWLHESVFAPWSSLSELHHSLFSQSPMGISIEVFIWTYVLIFLA